MSDEGPRVFDGRQWVTVAATSEPDDTTASPVKQVVDGDGKIFVSIASYRGTCHILVGHPSCTTRKITHALTFHHHSIRRRRTLWRNDQVAVRECRRTR